MNSLYQLVPWQPFILENLKQTHLGWVFGSRSSYHPFVFFFGGLFYTIRFKVGLLSRQWSTGQIQSLLHQAPQWDLVNKESHLWSIWVFPKKRVPQNGWFIMENHIKMEDLGVHLFLETPICILKWLVGFIYITLNSKLRCNASKKMPGHVWPPHNHITA